MAESKGEAKEYETHDNGGRPFVVRVSGQQVQIYRKHEDGAGVRRELLCDRKVAQVFIGTSPLCPMTSSSGGSGPDFDGNTILLRLEADKLDYFFIAGAVEKFTALAAIERLVSPVGNSDVPYPFALDTEGRVYLFLERAVTAHSTALRKCIDEECDAYEYYWQHKPPATKLTFTDMFPVQSHASAFSAAPVRAS